MRSGAIFCKFHDISCDTISSVKINVFTRYSVTKPGTIIICNFITYHPLVIVTLSDGCQHWRNVKLRIEYLCICAVCACGPHITVLLVKVGPTGHGSVASET